MALKKCNNAVTQISLFLISYKTKYVACLIGGEKSMQMFEEKFGWFHSTQCLLQVKHSLLYIDFICCDSFVLKGIVGFTYKHCVTFKIKLFSLVD